MAFCLTPAHAGGLPPLSGTHWWPSPSHRHVPVSICLLPMRAGALLPVNSARQCPALCHWRTRVAFHLSPACDGGLPPVIGVRHCLSVCHRSVPVTFPRSPALTVGHLPLTGMRRRPSLSHRCRWPLPSHPHAPMAFPLSMACAEAVGLSPACAGVLPPLTSERQFPSSHRCSLVAFCLSLSCICGIPTITGTCWRPPSSHHPCRSLTACPQGMPVAFSLSPAHAGGLLPVTSVCRRPFACHCHTPVAFPLSLLRVTLPFTSTHQWASSCHQHMPVANDRWQSTGTCR